MRVFSHGIWLQIYVRAGAYDREDDKSEQGKESNSSVMYLSREFLERKIFCLHANFEAALFQHPGIKVLLI
jgi:hypothetical protein